MLINSDVLTNILSFCDTPIIYSSVCPDIYNIIKKINIYDVSIKYNQLIFGIEDYDIAKTYSWIIKFKNILNNKKINDYVTLIISNFKNLNYLYIDCCFIFTKDNLIKILKNCSNLKIVKIPFKDVNLENISIYSPIDCKIYINYSEYKEQYLNNKNIGVICDDIEDDKLKYFHDNNLCSNTDLWKKLLMSNYRAMIWNNNIKIYHNGSTMSFSFDDNFMYSCSIKKLFLCALAKCKMYDYQDPSLYKTILEAVDLIKFMDDDLILKIIEFDFFEIIEKLINKKYDMKKLYNNKKFDNLIITKIKSEKNRQYIVKFFKNGYNISRLQNNYSLEISFINFLNDDSKEGLKFMRQMEYDHNKILYKENIIDHLKNLMDENKNVNKIIMNLGNYDYDIKNIIDENIMNDIFIQNLKNKKLEFMNFLLEKGFQVKKIIKQINDVVNFIIDNKILKSDFKCLCFIFEKLLCSSILEFDRINDLTNNLVIQFKFSCLDELINLGYDLYNIKNNIIDFVHLLLMSLMKKNNKIDDIKEIDNVIIDKILSFLIKNKFSLIDLQFKEDFNNIVEYMVTNNKLLSVKLYMLIYYKFDVLDKTHDINTIIRHNVDDLLKIFLNNNVDLNIKINNFLIPLIIKKSCEQVNEQNNIFKNVLTNSQTKVNKTIKEIYLSDQTILNSINNNNIDEIILSIKIGYDVNKIFELIDVDKFIKIINNKNYKLLDYLLFVNPFLIIKTECETFDIFVIDIIKNNKKDILEYILKINYKPNKIIGCCNSVFYSLMTNNDFDIINLLINSGILINDIIANIENNKMDDIIFILVKNARCGLLELILNNGYSLVNIIDSDKMKSLIEYLLNENKDECNDMVCLLISH